MSFSQPGSSPSPKPRRKPGAAARLKKPRVTSISIDGELLSKVGQRAIRDGMSISAWLSRAATLALRRK